MDVIAGKFRFNFRAELLCSCSVMGIGNLQPDVLVLRHAAETLIDVLLMALIIMVLPWVVVLAFAKASSFSP